MSAREDPPRLVDSDDPVLRAALGAGRGELPGDERMRVLSAALVARLPVGGGGGGGSPGDAAPHGSEGSAAGTGGAAAGAGAVGAGAAAGGVGGVTAIVGGAAVVMAVALGIWSSGRSDAPIAAVSATPIETSAAPMDLPSAPSASATATPPASSSAAVDTLPFDALPSAAASAVAAPAAAPEAEMEVFKRAQAALGSGDAAGALAACVAHQQAYPRSPFAQEREVIAIDALVRLGRRGEASARADRFAKTWPSSGHNRRIDALLGR